MTIRTKGNLTNRRSGKYSACLHYLQSNHDIRISGKPFGHGRKICIVGFSTGIALSLMSINLNAQELSLNITGKVSNEQGQGMQGVEVKVANTKTSTISYTDAFGNYNINIESYPTGIKDINNIQTELTPGIIQRTIYDISGREIVSDKVILNSNGTLDQIAQVMNLKRQIYVQELRDEKGYFTAEKFIPTQIGAQPPITIPEIKPDLEKVNNNSRFKTGNTNETYAYQLLINFEDLSKLVKVEGFKKSETEHIQNLVLNTNPENYLLVEGKITELLNNSKPIISVLEMFNADESFKVQGIIDDNNQYIIALPKNQAGTLLAFHLEGKSEAGEVSMPIFHGATFTGDTVYNVKTIDMEGLNKKVMEQAMLPYPFFTTWWHPDLLKVNPETGKNGITNYICSKICTQNEIGRYVATDENVPQEIFDIIQNQEDYFDPFYEDLFKNSTKEFGNTELYGYHHGHLITLIMDDLNFGEGELSFSFKDGYRTMATSIVTMDGYNRDPEHFKITVGTERLFNANVGPVMRNQGISTLADEALGFYNYPNSELSVHDKKCEDIYNELHKFAEDFKGYMFGYDQELIDNGFKTNTTMRTSAENFLTAKYFNWGFGGSRPISEEGETFILYQTINKDGSTNNVKYDINNVETAPKEIQEMGRELFQ